MPDGGMPGAQQHMAGGFGQFQGSPASAAPQAAENAMPAPEVDRFASLVIGLKPTGPPAAGPGAAAAAPAGNPFA